MAKPKKRAIHVGADKWKMGHLHLIDELPPGDPGLGSGIMTFAHSVDTNRQSRHWIRAVQWIENILFTAGRHYVDDILVSRLSRDSNNDLSIVNEATRNIPRPVNDLLGRYIETNIALLTENRPRPRVTPKSGRAEDEDAAELSELTLEYLWESLNMPELHREIARIILNCGICWMEILYDETQVRRITVPKTTEQATTTITGPTGGTAQIPVPQHIPVTDAAGRFEFTDKVEYGDITAKVCSPFEMHLPVTHWWGEEDWIMREYYAPKQQLLDRYSAGKGKMGLNKKDGWYLDRLDKVGTINVRNLPLWWWERLSDLVEGPGPSIYVGTPEQWEGYTVTRIFDRRPNPKWPRGRTVIVSGESVIYDSPRDRGARAYDPRWPTRWHPYIRFRWEPMVGSVYGRSLTSKLLPKLKRVNAIDTTMIMWRRTVPIATWIAPKGSHPIDDLWSGRPGGIWEYDPRRTHNKAPEPVFAPDYPSSAIEERKTQIAEMESIAGTEEVLRGQRPAGVNSASMLDVLRKQALASRSSILQAWDESLQKEGSALLQESIKHIKDDPMWAERIRIIARENSSRLSILKFSGSDLSDNVDVRVDTASLALVSKEAREQKAIEILQYAPGLMQLPVNLREAFFHEVGWSQHLKPQGVDINRAKRMLSWIRQGEFERIIPFPEDDPYIFYDIFVQEYKGEAFSDLTEQQQMLLLGLIDIYKQAIEAREAQKMKMMMMQQQLPGAGGGGGGGEPQQ